MMGPRERLAFIRSYAATWFVLKVAMLYALGVMIGKMFLWFGWPIATLCLVVFFAWLIDSWNEGESRAKEYLQRKEAKVHGEETSPLN